MLIRRANRSVWLACSLAGLLLAACASATPAPTPTLPPTVAIPATVAVTSTAAPSATAIDTVTAVASSTAVASTTAAPSATAADTATAAASGTAAASSTLAASATAVPPTPTISPSKIATAAEYTPQQTSVWDTELSPNTDNMQGTCSGPVTPVYGLVQITPQGGTLVWKNQEPAPYTLSRVRANTWQFSGPNGLNDGTVTLVVQFTSATTLQLTRTFVASAEPNCTHVHHYAGVFKWYR